MRILIVTTCFAPKNVIGAVRLSKLAKYFIREGHDITVISPTLEEYDKRDETLECEELEKANRITVPYSRLTTTLTGKHKKNDNGNAGNVANQINTSAKSQMYKALRDAFAWWRDFEWCTKAKKVVDTLDSFDVVLSSYPHVAAHDVALYTKKCGKASNWIADFRDPLVLESGVGKRHERQVRKQSKIVHEADYVVYVTQAGARNFICYPGDLNKVVWIPNGYDKEDVRELKSTDCKEIINSDQVVLSYTGGMYHGERDLRPFFKAVRNLIDRQMLPENVVCLHYAGADFSVLLQQAEEYDLKGILINHGVVARSEALDIQYNSDCVVVATFCYKDGEGAVPGKVYEPIMMSKPILMLVSGTGHHCEAASFIKHINAGCCYEAADDGEDMSEIERYLLELVKEKSNGCIKSNINTEILEQYQYHNIARKMLDHVGSDCL